MQFGNARSRFRLQFLDRAKLDRVCRARLGAGRLEAAVQPIVTQRAFVCLAVVQVQIDDAEGTRRDTVTAAVAHVLLHDDVAELGVIERAGRARLNAAGVGACLHTSLAMSQLLWKGGIDVGRSPARMPRFSMKATCRHVVADRPLVLS